MSKPYNDLEPHDRSVASDRLAMAAWEAAQDDDYDDDIDYDVDYSEDNNNNYECPLCGRTTCSGYCEI